MARWSASWSPSRKVRRFTDQLSRWFSFGPTEGGINLSERAFPQMLLECAGMYEIVAEPGAFLGVELLDRPIDHAAHPRHRSEIGMVAQPDVEGINQIDVERDHRRTDRETVCRQPAHRQAAYDRGIKSGADVGAHRDK